ncbi:hypothetical protein C5167_005249 [Papaver somniferum]|uniref:NAD-dependent epimerase/dehydratase domain-containing protein n=1 Tax=Papaver somniferum TaxID=3469 RepID=A0A4Y7JA26_PAPSO|nr:hypothetical protein C5167_005249 [Papaver somniferum]
MEGGSGVKKGVVCVTGGAGYIGSWLIMRLVQRGYTVRATVRLDPGKPRRPSGKKRDISHLTNLPGASERLQIFDADLEKRHSFDQAIKGCVGVFQVAYPADFVDGNEADDATGKTVIARNLDILKACLRSKTVKRVVYTSTAAAVFVNKSGLKEMDENSWSDVEFCRDMKIHGSSYIIPQTLIEQATLKFGEDNGLDVVSIILPLVVGPFTCPHLPGSISVSLAMILGTKYGPDVVLKKH